MDFAQKRAFAQIAEEVLCLLAGCDIEYVHNKSSQDLTGSFGKWQRHLGIVFELIENSILATRNQRSPEIEITVRGGTVVIQDNGPGMTHRELFRYFLQPDASGWQDLGILQLDQTYVRCGLGVTGGLMWCESLVVESKKVGHTPCGLALTIRNLTDITLCPREPDTTSRRPYGTRIAVDLCLTPRAVWPQDGMEYRKIWDIPVGQVESLVELSIKDVCSMVDDSVAIMLNGDRINSVGNRGAGPFVAVARGLAGEAYKDKQDVHLTVYSAPSRGGRGETTWWEPERKLECWLELYQNGLLISCTTGVQISGIFQAGGLI